jgi:hypothetical protein
MKKLLIFLVALILLIIFIPGAQAATIADWSFDFDTGMETNLVGDNLPTHFSLIFIESSDPNSIAAELIGGLVDPPVVSGSPIQFVWDSFDAGFGAAVDVLTNGIKDYIGILHAYPDSSEAGYSVSESWAFASDPGFTDPDLMGSVINKITLEIHTYSNSVTYSDLLQGNEIRSYDTGNIIIEGSPIPEPTSLLLLGTGLGVLGLAAYRRRRK